MESFAAAAVAVAVEVIEAAVVECWTFAAAVAVAVATTGIATMMANDWRSSICLADYCWATAVRMDSAYYHWGCYCQLC